MGYTVASSWVCVPEKDRLRLCRVGVDVGCEWMDGWLPCTVDLPRFVAPRSMVPTLAESTWILVTPPPTPHLPLPPTHRTWVTSYSRPFSLVSYTLTISLLLTLPFEPPIGPLYPSGRHFLSGFGELLFLFLSMDFFGNGFTGCGALRSIWVNFAFAVVLCCCEVILW